ncbi:hypothetical protein TcasGA2_TC034565, partial [Tribolium castaneum]
PRESRLKGPRRSHSRARCCPRRPGPNWFFVDDIEFTVTMVTHSGKLVLSLHSTRFCIPRGRARGPTRNYPPDDIRNAASGWAEEVTDILTNV